MMYSKHALHLHSHLLLQTILASSARSNSWTSFACLIVGDGRLFSGAGLARNHQRRRHQLQQHQPLPIPWLHRRSSTIFSRVVSGYLSQRRFSYMLHSSQDGGDDLSEHDNTSKVPDETSTSAPANHFQQFITSRRTVSNFIYRSSSDQSSDRQFLQEAISRGVQCAATAPNHKITEPTTFHRILTPSGASRRLSDIAYEVTFQRLVQNKLSGEEACRNEAMRKREKWSTIPAFVVVTVSGMEDQTSGNDCSGEDLYKELPYVPPATIRQLEDYASACASIQNLLLSLHSEGLGAKWATGPVINTNAFRELIQCGRNDMIVGLIMVGWPKQLPKMKRRRGLEGDLLKDVDFGADERVSDCRKISNYLEMSMM